MPVAEAVKPTWAPEMLVMVRRGYDGTPVTIHDLANKLSCLCGRKVTYAAVRNKIRRMGLQRSKAKRLWTETEDNILMSLVEHNCIQTIAMKLKRSEGAVATRIKLLKLSRRNRDGWYTIGDLCDIFGVSDNWVKFRIEQGIIKATRHYARNGDNGDGRSWHIDRKDLVLFIRVYPQELIGRQVDIIQIVDLLAGILVNNNKKDNGGYR